MVCFAEPPVIIDPCCDESPSVINSKAAGYFTTPRLMRAARNTSMRSRLTPKS